MADLTNSTWSETDSNNTQPAPSGFPSGILPSQVGGVIRAMMGATKRAYNHGNAMVSSTGSANAYALTYEQSPQNGYVRGEVFRFFANFTNTAAATININGLGVRNILRADGNALAPGEIVSGQVITVVYDGASFLAQNITTKNLRENVSISKDSDAVLALEDTSAPTNTFRRKGILSSKNVGGGNDWLFRQTRPSDGATEDFTLKNGSGGTIWTTGNFNPDTKANAANPSLTGTVSMPSNGGEAFQVKLGTGDGASFATHNTRFKTWFGLGIESYDGVVRGVYDSRGGVWNTMGVPQVNGQAVWYPGNFNPANYAALNTSARFLNVVLGARESLVYSDPNTDNVRMRSGNASIGYKYAGLNDDGTFQIFSGGVDAGGDVRASGNLRTGLDLFVGEGRTSSSIVMKDTNEGDRYIHNNGGTIGFLNTYGSWAFKSFDDGNMWTPLFGYLNEYVTNQANRGRDEANNNSNANFFNKTIGTAQQVANTPSFNNGAIDIVRPNVLRARFLVDGSGNTILQNGDNGDNFFWVNTAGAIWTKQFGDLNTRIESRAAAFADDRAGKRVAKTGDTMTGNLTIAAGYPRVRFDYTNTRIWNIGLREDGHLWFEDEWGGNQNFRFATDGSIWTRQFGDLNSRIEDRARAWAETRQGNLGFTPIEQGGGPYQHANKVRLGWDGSGLRLSVDGGDQDKLLSLNWINPVTDLRMAYAGDLNSTWNENNNNFAEPYAGAVVTTLNFISSGAAGSHIGGARWRYIQKRDAYGNWYTVGYA